MSYFGCVCYQLTTKTLVLCDHGIPLALTTLTGVTLVMLPKVLHTQCPSACPPVRPHP